MPTEDGRQCNALPNRLGLGILAIRQDNLREKIFPSFHYGKFFSKATLAKEVGNTPPVPFQGKRPQTPAILFLAKDKRLYYLTLYT
jgi:hypothetical protein